MAALDPESAAADPAMTTLPLALDPIAAGAIFARECPALAGSPGIEAISVMRYRPGRRCLLRYGLADGTAVIGKVTAKGVHRRSLAVQTRLHEAGFRADSPDGIAVPGPLGAVPSLGMWLQREVPGLPLDRLLDGPDAVPSCERAALTLAKLHRQQAGTAPVWTTTDELRVLDDRLERLARAAGRTSPAARTASSPPATKPPPACPPPTSAASTATSIPSS
jgi:hypothetical protein